MYQTGPNPTEDFWPRLCNLEGRVWTGASLRDERALWYIITIFVMLWRGIRFPLRDGKKEGGGSGSERTEGERDAKIAAFRQSTVRDSIYMLCYMTGQEN